jgi:hypothetical protein
MTQTSVWSATTAERRATSPETALRVSAREKLSVATARRKATLPATALRDQRRRMWNATTAMKLDTLPATAPVCLILSRIKSQLMYISDMYLQFYLLMMGWMG